MRSKGPKKLATPKQLMSMRICALISYLALFALVLLWNTVIAPSKVHPTGLVLFFTALPLLFPFWGILNGKAYTHAWTSFLALYYFTLGVGDAYSDQEDRLYGILVTALSSTLFISSMLYARFKGRQDNTSNSPSDVTSDLENN